MQKVKLPQNIDPVKSAIKRSDYVGVIATKDMVRLLDAVIRCDEYANVKVKFEKDAQGLVIFHGSVSVDVSLSCQRCNGELAHSLDLSFCFSPVQGVEQADEIPEAYEPIEVNEYGEIDLFQLLEDELILGLPLVPLHAEEQCSVKPEDMTFGQIAEEPTRENPFAVLKELKRDQE
ncbi:23S rRNA accumulation protein YceD [Alteromonas facilis]|uniref:23S rRNA accumulation protein YceD n=1 Tax=Alteromonas facilis TaxID=2048004 RepID=UPI000C28991C|nr:23S rRNA accumulation protein YceD [Alteromonas facilis]